MQVYIRRRILICLFVCVHRTQVYIMGSLVVLFVSKILDEWPVPECVGISALSSLSR